MLRLAVYAIDWTKHTVVTNAARVQEVNYTSAPSRGILRVDAGITCILMS